MKVAVIGVGRMGRHHARIYRHLPQTELVGVVDQDPQRLDAVASEYDCQAYPSPTVLLDDQPELAAVSIAVPTQLHYTVTCPLLERGVACLVEKPLAPSVTEARALAAVAEKCRTVLQVGHTERFNPAVRAVASMNITPRFIEVHRISPMTFRSLDVGVVMDMMIHDLDIVLMLTRSPIRRVDATGVAVLGEHEDIVNTRITFESGGVANLTASRLALKTERKLRLFSESAYVSLDYQKRSGVVISKSNNVDALENVRKQIAGGEDLSNIDYSSLVNVEQLTMDLPPGEEDPLTAELANFIQAARTRQTPLVSAEAGYAAVDAAERVVNAVKEHKWEGLNDPELGLVND